MNRFEALKVLSLSEQFDTAALKRAYRLNAKRHHPDRGGDETLFKYVCEAYRVLSEKPKSVVTVDWTAFTQSVADTFKPANDAMKETQFKNKIVAMLKEEGAKTFKIHGSEWQEPGWPDLYVAHKMWTGWLELKVNAGESDLQRKRIADLRIRGVYAAFMRYSDKIIRVYDHCGVDNTITLPIKALLPELKVIFAAR